MFFPVTEISENRVAGIQIIFQLCGFLGGGEGLKVWVFLCVCFLNPYGLYPKKFVTDVLSTFSLMLCNTLDLKTQESTSLFQSKHNTAVDIRLGWAGTYCHILLTKNQKKFAFSHWQAHTLLSKYLSPSLLPLV